jgi:hypothetical protein
MRNYIKLIFRPTVLKAVVRLLTAVGAASEDNKLTAKERSKVLTAMWDLVRVYRGEGQRPSP